MINYIWTDLQIGIQCDTILFQDPFSGYRVEEAEPDCVCTVRFVSPAQTVPPATLPAVYENSLFRVTGMGETERIWYRNPLNGAFVSVLEEREGEKLLRVREDYCPYPELFLLNHLNLEKTMNEHGRLLLHASFIETERGAVLFTAPSGTGKSTQAELWRQHRGAVIVNGDRAGIWRGEQGWLAGGVPWSGTSGISLNRILPLRAVVILRQGPENVLETPRASESLKALMEQTTINPWNREMYLRTQEQLIDLVQSVPVYRLRCRPDEGAVEVLARELGL